MDKKTYSIGVLSIIASVLLVANLIPVPAANGSTAVKDRDYTLTTTRGQRGGEVLFVIDNRTGAIAAINLGPRGLQPIAVDTLLALSPPK